MSVQPEHGYPQVSAAEIQLLTRPEAISLSRMWNELYPGDKVTTAQFRGGVDRLLNSGGRAWILRYESTVTGYATLAPTPGLPGLYEVDGFIAAAYRRKGLATIFLHTIAGQLANSAVRQIFHAVDSSSSSAGQFLMKNGFYIEHEEQQLILEDLQTLPQSQLGDGYSLRTYGMQRSIGLFRQLYEEAFKGLAWYQPYESDLEVARDLADADDLLFLTDGGRPVGFLWLRWPDQQTAEFEPLGLLPAYRGQGLGEQLMLSGISYAIQHGAKRARVGAWRQNRPALSLYEGLGFQRSGQRIFLAYDV